MNKKGFTLIEIIVVVALIGLVGVSSIIVTVKNSDNKLSKVTKTILESAQVYLELEMDEKGNSFKDGLLLGGTAVSIPLEELINTGYIKEDVITTLEKEGVRDAKNNYVLAAVFSGAVDECEDNQSVIEFKASWVDELKNATETMYLCEYSSDDIIINNIIKNETVINNIVKNETVINKVINNIAVLNEHLNLKVDLDKVAVSKEYYDSLPNEAKDSYTYKENGVFIYSDEDLNTVYSYYRGAVDNNYLKLGVDSEGNDLFWRILWLSDDNRMKLVLDEDIPLSITNKLGETVLLSDTNKTMEKLENYVYMDATINSYRDDPDYKWYFLMYDLIVPTDRFFNEFINLKDGTDYYLNEMRRWYNSTSLNEYNYILKTNNFCKNTCMYNTDEDRDGWKTNYNRSNKFACFAGDYEKGSCENIVESNYSSPVGFLTYGDVLRAGLTEGEKTISLLNSGNYLVNSNNSFLLSDQKEYSYRIHRGDGDGFYDESIKHYFYDQYGVRNNYFYQKFRQDEDAAHLNEYILYENDKSKKLLDVYGYGKDGAMIETSTFLGTAIKPAIVVDLTNKKLVGDGVKASPFIIVDK